MTRLQAESAMYVPLPENLESALRANPIVSRTFDEWEDIALPNCWMVAGAVFQSFWNQEYGFPPLHGIADIDLIYFDARDLSEHKENEHYVRINDFFDDENIRFDVKNEARVHLWYEDRFGYPVDAYTSAEAAMETFQTTAGAIGIRCTGQDLEAFAPFGFDDLMNLTIRPNKRQITRTIYEEKVARWKPKWPDVNYLEWDEA